MLDFVRTREFTMVIVASVLIALGVVIVSTPHETKATPQAVVRDCAADRRALVIAIDSYRQRFGAESDPARWDLEDNRLLEPVALPSYTVVYENHVARLLPVSGTGCA